MEPMIVALAAVLVVVGGIATYLDSPTRHRGRVSILRANTRHLPRS